MFEKDFLFLTFSSGSNSTPSESRGVVFRFEQPPSSADPPMRSCDKLWLERLELLRKFKCSENPPKKLQGHLGFYVMCIWWCSGWIFSKRNTYGDNNPLPEYKTTPLKPWCNRVFHTSGTTQEVIHIQGTLKLGNWGCNSIEASISMEVSQNGSTPKHPF